MSRAVTVSVSERQRTILERYRKSKAGTSAQLVERSSIVLMCADGMSNTGLGRRLGIDRQRARRWRTRWSENQERLAEAEREGASDHDLAKLVRELLSDEDRPGAPPTFGAEQLVQIFAVACEPPEESGRPVTHWTPRELAAEVIERGIVETISPRHIDRLLKGGISAHTRHSTG